MTKGQKKIKQLNILPEDGILLCDIQTIFSDYKGCLLYTSPSPRDSWASRMPSSAWKKKINKYKNQTNKLLKYKTLSNNNVVYLN